MPRPILQNPGVAVPFFFPQIAGNQYRPGRQPFSPGESQMDSGGPVFNPIPWPNAVPSLLALANDPGTPRARALQINNNAEAVLPANWLFIAGFAGKSQG